MKAITETWISLEEENSDDDNCEGDLFEEEKNDEDEDTDIESEEEIEEIFELSKLPDTTVKEKENSSKLTCRKVNMTNVWNKCSKSRKVVRALMVFMQKFKENSTNESLVYQKFHPPKI